MKTTKLNIALLLIIAVLGCSNQNSDIIKRKTFSMGTMMEIQVSGVSEETANKAITEAFREIEKLNSLYSTYKKNNYIWDLNNAVSDTIVVFPQTFEILTLCNTAFKLTNGNFDAGIGNFIEILGFENNKPNLPDKEAIENTLKKVGWKNVVLQEGNILIKPKLVKLSFNALLPGFAADAAGKILENFGISEYLINAGGEVYGAGREWTIGIQHPRKKNELMGTLLVQNMGVATSGDYERYFKKDGKRYSHIIDPLTGYPIDRCEAVTIIAPTAVMADYLSTGVFVAGPEKGMQIIEKLPNVEGVIVDTLGVIHESSGFKKYFRR